MAKKRRHEGLVTRADRVGLQVSVWQGGPGERQKYQFVIVDRENGVSIETVSAVLSGLGAAELYLDGFEAALDLLAHRGRKGELFRESRERRLEMEAVYTCEMAGGMVKGALYQDQYPESPREWDNLGRMLCRHRRYLLGDEQVKSEEEIWERIAVESGWPGREAKEEEAGDEFDDATYCCERADWIEEHAVVLPLFLMDHSRLTMRTTSAQFAAFDKQGWDWGQVGVIYVTLEKARAESPDWSREQIEAVLEEEVRTYDRWMSGDVYTAKAELVNGQEDSLGGLYGYFEARKELDQLMVDLLERVGLKLIEDDTPCPASE